MDKKSLLPILLVPALILLIPATAMLFRIDGWGWDAADFILAWLLMTGVGVTYKLLTIKTADRTYRIATGIALAAGLILIWINGAVGLIGNEDNPANQMYVGVLAVGVIGALIARSKPQGMFVALSATALAQLMVPFIAMLIWRPDFSLGVMAVLGLNFFFVLAFAGSAWLYRRAARIQDGHRVEMVG